MTLLFEEDVTVPFVFDYKQTAKDVIEESLSEEGFPYEVEIGLTITDDDTIQQVNQEFREIDCATDVLSFPMVEYKKAGDFRHLEDMEDIFHPETGEVMLGDIMISTDHVLAQAKEYGHSEKREFAFLIAHSMLHLMGYDHIEDAEASLMEEKQSTILDKLNITRED